MANDGTLSQWTAGRLKSGPEADEYGYSFSIYCPGVRADLPYSLEISCVKTGRSVRKAFDSEDGAKSFAKDVMAIFSLE